MSSVCQKRVKVLLSTSKKNNKSSPAGGLRTPAGRRFKTMTGWIEINNTTDVYIENGFFSHATQKKQNNQYIKVKIYTPVREGSYRSVGKIDRITLQALKRGLKKGKFIVM